MEPILRPYQPDDFDRVSAFLIAHFLPGNRDGNWLQPAWEYMHTHPALDEASLQRIGVWEANGEIVGVAQYESSLGEAFFQLHPGHVGLKAAMLAYAERHLSEPAEDGRTHLRVYVNDFDHGFGSLVQERGYGLDSDYARPVSMMPIVRCPPPNRLPMGFRLQSLAEDNDLRKIHRVLWRGFNHPGEPLEDGLADRSKMQSGPNFRKDLTIVIEGPSGDFVSFCGLWYEPTNQIAYVEPMATDPDYRKLGLGKAALLEGLRRCAALGATTAFVGSDQEFYRAVGFTRTHTAACWEKLW